MSRRLRSVGAIAIIALAVPMQSCERSVLVPGLYSYSIQDWNAAALRQGWKGSWPNLRRNSDGSRLYCHSWDSGTVIVLSGSSHSELLRAPAKLSYLNDAGQFVAWGDDIRVGFQIVSGPFVATSWPDGRSGHFGVDPSGRFFFVAKGPRRTIIAPISAPNTVLAESAFQGRWLFARGERLFMFGQIFEDTSYGEEILADIFESVSGSWRLVRSLRMRRSGGWQPSPYYVADMDPEAARVLVVDSRDMRADRYYLHDLDSGANTRVTLAQGNSVLFLKEDLLGSTTSHNDGLQRTSAAQAMDARR